MKPEQLDNCDLVMEIAEQKNSDVLDFVDATCKLSNGNTNSLYKVLYVEPSEKQGYYLMYLQKIEDLDDDFGGNVNYNSSMLH